MVTKEENPDKFRELVEKEIVRRLKSLVDTKEDLMSSGVGLENLIYLDANDNDPSDGDRLGALFISEDDIIEVIENQMNAKVFHFDPEHQHVTITVDLRDEETIFFYLADSLDKDDYRELLQTRKSFTCNK
jgi:hypothetical protein